MQNGETMLCKLSITPLGYLFLETQYEHAAYKAGAFSLRTGLKQTRYPNEPDSLSSRCAPQHVVRITQRDANGNIIKQRLRADSRVPPKASQWLRETGLFPKY